LPERANGDECRLKRSQADAGESLQGGSARRRQGPVVAIAQRPRAHPRRWHYRHFWIPACAGMTLVRGSLEHAGHRRRNARLAARKLISSPASSGWR
jgi:hypothetical protein